jgi:hypothetical protein
VCSLQTDPRVYQRYAVLTNIGLKY